MASGRPCSTELIKEEIIERQNVKIKLLETQVELLKKLDVRERQVFQRNNKFNVVYSLKRIRRIMKKYMKVLP